LIPAAFLRSGPKEVSRLTGVSWVVPFLSLAPE
jgi:hypothetical protein